MSQLPLPIAWSQRGDTGDLLITAANADAIALIRDPSCWPSPCTVLVGPARSGRSLIGRMFLASGDGLLVDDAQQADEERLFNLWNDARDQARPLLLIAHEAPPLWPVRLPDLRTRLATAAIARILPPDDATTAALITHGLQQAGSSFAPDMPDFVARRVTRCYETIDSVIACLNAESLAAGRKLTVASARGVLLAEGLLSEGQADEHGRYAPEQQTGAGHHG